MRKYYLFKIKAENLNNKKLYNILEELFYLNRNKFEYGNYIFSNLCSYLNKDELILKLKDKFDIKENKIIINDLENTSIKINNICIVIETNKNVSIIFKYLNDIEKHFFVCDFKNKDYFLLNNFVQLNLKINC